MNGSRRSLLAVTALGTALFLATSAAEAAYSPATTNGWFIFAGRVAGLNNSLFRTDVWLFNPETSFSTVTLTFREQVQSGAAAQTPINSAPIVLGPRETKFFSDVTFTSPISAGDGKVGSLEWTSDRPIMGASRVYTVATQGSCVGTFGFFLPGIPTTESMGPKQSGLDSVNALQMYGVNTVDPNFRTNLDVTNTSSATVPIEVRVIDPVTNLLYGGVQNFSLAPKSLIRLGQIAAAVLPPPRDGLRITVAIRDGTIIPGDLGGILAVATTLDNRTNDAFAFTGQRQSGTIVPAVLLPLSDLQ